MLTANQRARILRHLEHGWKLPDSLVQELWEAYETLAANVSQPDGDPYAAHDGLSDQTDNNQFDQSGDPFLPRR